MNICAYGIGNRQHFVLIELDFRLNEVIGQKTSNILYKADLFCLTPLGRELRALISKTYTFADKVGINYKIRQLFMFTNTAVTKIGLARIYGRDFFIYTSSGKQPVQFMEMDTNLYTSTIYN